MQRSAAFKAWEDDHEGLGRRRSAMFVFTVSRTEGNCEYIQMKMVGVGARVNPGHPTYEI